MIRGRPSQAASLGWSILRGACCRPYRKNDNVQRPDQLGGGGSLTCGYQHQSAQSHGSPTAAPTSRSFLHPRMTISIFEWR
jgi:hypothetical protein